MWVCVCVIVIVCECVSVVRWSAIEWARRSVYITFFCLFFQAPPDYCRQTMTSTPIKASVHR